MIDQNQTRATSSEALGNFAVVYTRFSPRPDAARSESCDVQLAMCEEFADKNGITIRKAFNDRDRSGADEFRETLWSAIDSLRKGDVLLVAKRDRLARNVYLSETINRAVNKKGCKIVAVSGDVDGDGPEQTLVRQIVAAMAEYERKIISARTSSTMRAYQKGGRRVGGKIPYGYMVDPNNSSRIVENENEQKGLIDIVKMHSEGVSLLQMMKRLDPSTARCGKWYYTQLRRTFERLKRDGIIKE